MNLQPEFEFARLSPGRLLARLALVLAASFALHAGAASAAAAVPEGAGAKVQQEAPSATYYKRSQLDARPYLVTKVSPVYPPGVPPTGSKARIRLFINERGFVDRVKVVESAASAKFGEAAADAFRKAQFEPGKLKGAAVKSQILIEVDFPSLLPPGVK